MAEAARPGAPVAVPGRTAPRVVDLAEAGSRGSLTVAEQAVRTIVRAAALGVRGVAPASATAARVAGALGRDLPRAHVDLAGHRARVEVEVASLWPHPAAEVAAGVRAEVTAQLRDLAAVTADSVSVTVARVVRTAHPSGRVR
ncbi:Asp23/Gls24 family envelope stress response protein [Kineococcus gypseus]|uniref:Asp23/Gls24 family envelope stress response protein n=1 Tax=Kineococcus gypseus TaxID=1637102 RepID=UPI003D7D599B